MARIAEGYHRLDSTLSSRERTDAVLSACFEGDVSGAAEMLGPCEDADDLLAHGMVTYWRARTQTGYSYELAKDLLSKSSRLFEERGELPRARLADIWVGLCYWREGQFPEAFILLNKSAESSDPQVKFYALVNISVFQTEYSRWRFALATLNTAQPFFDLQVSESWKGKFFQQRGLAYKQAYNETQNTGYLDKALTDYEAASDYYEAAGNLRFEAAILNNVAGIYKSVGQLQRARNSVDRAITIYERISDRSHLGHAKDTKAQILLADNDLLRAKKYADQSITLLRKNDPAWVLTPLATRAKINFKMGLTTAALADFEEAIEIAEASGNAIGCVSVYLDQAEVMASILSAQTLADIFRRVNELSPSREAKIAQKVLESAVVPRLHSLKDLKSAELKQEREMIVTALEKAAGSVTSAAKQLGKTHGGLTHIIRTRHPDLKRLCRPIVPRRRSIVKSSRS